MPATPTVDRQKHETDSSGRESGSSNIQDIEPLLGPASMSLRHADWEHVRCCEFRLSGLATVVCGSMMPADRLRSGLRMTAVFCMPFTLPSLHWGEGTEEVISGRLQTAARTSDICRNNRPMIFVHATLAVMALSLPFALRAATHPDRPAPAGQSAIAPHLPHVPRLSTTLPPPERKVDRTLPNFLRQPATSLPTVTVPLKSSESMQCRVGARRNAPAARRLAPATAYPRSQQVIKPSGTSSSSPEGMRER